MVVIKVNIVILDGVDRVAVVLGSILIVFYLFLYNVNTCVVTMRSDHVPSLFIMKLPCYISTGERTRAFVLDHFMKKKIKQVSVGNI